jgi:hypothetical protein
LVSRAELRQEVFSWVLHYLLVSTIRNRPQIANEKSTIFKTEFFNRIDPTSPLAGVRTDSDSSLMAGQGGCCARHREPSSEKGS